ncbi:DUF1272 domain-containing protein [Nocardia sp. NPDC005825]|uniref:DUF1272 domain-containing protein n=1 Tax=unclassified Nocardia TaxID=2637762 RepID=UPI0033C93F13
MRTRCERCEIAHLPAEGPARICGYARTCCESCGRTMDYGCPNCGGELVARPRRRQES